MTTTLTVYADSGDALIYGSSTDYDTARNTASALATTDENYSVGQTSGAGLYEVYTAYLKFPSSDITATIYDRTAYARLSLSVYSLGYNGSTSNFDVDIIKQDWSAHDPLVSTDIETPYDDCFTDTKDVTWHEFTSSTAAGNTTFYSPPLDLDWISPTTDNYYSLRSNRANDSTAPGGAEIVVISSAESTDISYRPQLQLIYLDPSGDAIDYFLGIDWNDDGVYSDVNEADYMVKWNSVRGRRRLVGRPGGGFEPYRVGKLKLVLDNSDGRYNPWESTGALYGNLTPGKKMKFTCSVVSSTSASGYDRFDIFTGYTSKLIQRGWNKTVTLECEDGLGMLKRCENYITNENDDSPYYDPSDFFDDLLDFIEYPYGRDISTADPTSDIFGWSPIMLTDDALSSAEDVANAAIGSIAAETDGTFAYHSIYDTDTSILTLTDANTINPPYFPNPWEYKRTAVNIGAYYHMISLFDNITLVSSDNPILIGAGDTVTKEFRYTQTSASYSGNWYGGIFPSSSYNIFVSTSSTDSASTSTTDFAYTATIYPEKAVFDFTNSADTPQYINKFTAYNLDGYLTQYEGIEFKYGTTTNDWNNQEFNISSYYFGLAGYGDKEGYYSDYYPPTSSDYFGSTNVTEMQRARIDKMGNLLDTYLSTDHYFPTLQLEGRPVEQFTLDVEKQVTYSSALLGSTDDYRICGLRHESYGTPQIVRTTAYLYPVIPNTT